MLKLNSKMFDKHEKVPYMCHKIPQKIIFVPITLTQVL